MFRSFFALSASFLLLANPGFADDIQASFDPTTGRILIPNLVIDREVYYLELELTDAASLTFQANLETATAVTPTETTLAALESDLYGRWTIPEIGESQLEVVFNEDGSYTHFQNTDAGTDLACVGNEVGSYQWQPSTGVFVSSQTSDTNGDCGLSDPRGAFLFFVDGNTLTMTETGERGETFILTRLD